MNTLNTVPAFEHAIKIASRDSILEQYIAGTQTGDELVTHLLSLPDQRILTKTGTYFMSPAIERVPYALSRLMSTASTIARTMVEHGHIERYEAVEGLDKIHDQLMLLDSGYAAYSNKVAPVLTYENIRISTLDGDFDSMRASAPNPENLTEIQKAGLQNGDSSQKSVVSADEGVLDTGLHSAEDVLDISLDRMVYKRLNWFGTIYNVAWPDHSTWSALTNVLAANAIKKIEFNAQTLIPKWERDTEILANKVNSLTQKFGKNDAVTVVAARKLAKHLEDEPVATDTLRLKLQRQLFDIAHPFNEMVHASNAHWRVSTVMRFIYRRNLLADETIERFTGQIDRITASAHEEAMSGRPPQLTRLQTAQGEQREYNQLLFRTLTESTEFYESGDAQSNHFSDDREAFQPAESWTVTVAWYNQVINAVEAERVELNELYADLKDMENAVLPLWAANDKHMPQTPPLYWNGDGPHFTAEAALASFNKERIESAEKFLEANKELSADALRKAFALLPDGFSI